MTQFWRQAGYRLFGFLLAVLPVSVWAQSPYIEDDQGIFTPPATDVSVEYLRKIFGTVGATLTGGSNQLLGELFGLFNTAMLVFAGGFVMYSVAMSVVNTAQDGQAMGNKVSTWMIFRIVGGTSALIPKFNGYSFVQLLVMKAVLSGVGLADKVWEKAIDYIKDTGGFKVQVADVMEAADLKKMSLGQGVTNKISAMDIYKSGLCVAAASRQAELDSQDACIDDNCPPFRNTYGVFTGQSCGAGSSAYTVCLGSEADQTQCGKFSWAPPNAMDDDKAVGVFNAMRDATRSVLTSADIWFARAMRGDYIVCRESDSANGCAPANTMVQLGSGYYFATLQPRLEPPTPTSATNDWTQSAKRNGWIMAGSHYSDLVGGNARTTVGGGPSYIDADDVMYDASGQSRLAPGAASFPDGTVSQGLSIRDAYAAVVNALSGYSSKANELLNNIAGGPPSGGGIGDNVLVENELNDLTHQFWLSLDPEKGTLFKGGTGNFRAKSMVTSIKGGGRLDLNIAQKNMMVLLRNMVAQMVGLGGRLDWPNINRVGGSSGNSDPRGGYCSDTPGCPGQNCFVNAVQSGCIEYGRGILGGLAVDRGLTAPGTTNSDVAVRIDPLLGLAELGQTMMDLSVTYWTRTLNQVYQTVKDLAVSYTSYMTIGAVAATAASALAYLGGPVAGGAVSSVMGMLLQTANTIMQLLFQIDMASMQIFLPLGAMVAMATFMLGVSIGVYAPFIPFMLFMFGAIGWLAGVVEAMVAAPLVALGVTHPEGHDLLGKSEQATMLILGVFVRPATMIIGLFVAILLSYIALSLLNYGFLHILAQYLSMNFSGTQANISKLVGVVGMLIVYVYVLLAVLNQVFSLIHQIPDKLLLWIGGPMGQSTTAQAMQQVQQGVGQTMSQPAQGASQSAGQAPQMAPGASKMADVKYDRKGKGDKGGKGENKGSSGGK